jgi:hypothetical protein
MSRIAMNMPNTIDRKAMSRRSSVVSMAAALPVDAGIGFAAAVWAMACKVLPEV